MKQVAWLVTFWGYFVQQKCCFEMKRGWPAGLALEQIIPNKKISQMPDKKQG
jgi:hypothetical protein